MKDRTIIEIPRQLFRDLLWLQAFYAAQLNFRDGGLRRPIKLPRSLLKHLTDREKYARQQAIIEAR